MKLNELFESTKESPTLKKLFNDSKDNKSPDTPKVQTTHPVPAFPLPWKVKQVDPMGIYEIVAANEHTVVNWLNKATAEKIIDEIK